MLYSPPTHHLGVFVQPTVQHQDLRWQGTADIKQKFKKQKIYDLFIALAQPPSPDGYLVSPDVEVVLLVMAQPAHMGKPGFGT